MSTFKVSAICLTLVCTLAITLRADTITVTNTNDSGPGSLRQALMDANDGDTINATGVLGAITLTTGELIVGKSVTINGAGADVLAVDGNARSTVFQINPGETVTISALAVRNGNASFGGGIFNEATLTIASSTFSGNTAGLGGGIFNAGTLSVIDSTVSGNSANLGAGMYNNGTNTTITNSTFSGNTAIEGGAIVNHFPMQIASCTFSNNSAGGVLNTGTLEIGNSILNAGASGENISNGSGGTVTSLGYNLSSDDGDGFLNGPGDQINTDPRLGPLQDNGGPTLTHALLPDSPAIDAGDPNFTPPPFFDQRGPGFDRVVNGRIDKGSFEVQAPMAQSAFSRKNHGGAGTFDVPLPLTGNVGIEDRSGGVTNDYQMIINFATNVTVENASVTSGTGSVSTFAVNGPQVTVNLTGVINVQRITMTLHNVNDGTHIGDVPVSMGVLVGDTTANGVVNAGDVSQTKSQVGQAVNTSNFREDVNASGTITATDVAQVKAKVGTSLP